MKCAVEVSDLLFSYDELVILKQKKLEIEKGKLVGIIGPNGGGKTTFLKLLMGFLEPTAGQIRLFGKNPHKGNVSIGYVPQFHHCDRAFPITVYELVLLGALHKTTHFGMYPKEIKEKAQLLIEELGLKNHIQASFGSLSGGLAQRALLARALLANPDILLLDEPTANVDPATTTLIMEKLNELKGKKTILLVSHDLRNIVEKADQILCIEREITPYLPEEICSHFGVYHTPLSQPEKANEPDFVLH